MFRIHPLLDPDGIIDASHVLHVLPLDQLSLNYTLLYTLLVLLEHRTILFIVFFHGPGRTFHLVFVLGLFFFITAHHLLLTVRCHHFIGIDTGSNLAVLGR